MIAPPSSPAEAGGGRIVAMDLPTDTAALHAIIAAQAGELAVQADALAAAKAGPVSKCHSPNRKGKHPRGHLGDFRGHPHADGYAGFGELYLAKGAKPPPVGPALSIPPVMAACSSDLRSGMLPA